MSSRGGAVRLDTTEGPLGRGDGLSLASAVGAEGAIGSGAWIGTDGESSFGVPGATAFFGAAASRGASFAGAAAFFAGAFFGATPASPLVLAAAFFGAAAFLTGLSSSGCTSRTRPWARALRSSMGTKASTRVDWGDLAATLLARQRSNISALVMPSFLASSLTLIFAVATRRYSFDSFPPEDPATLQFAIVLRLCLVRRTFQARSNALFLRAATRHS